MLYTLNLYRAVYQLYVNKTGKNKTNIPMIVTKESEWMQGLLGSSVGDQGMQVQAVEAQTGSVHTLGYRDQLQVPM